MIRFVLFFLLSFFLFFSRLQLINFRYGFQLQRFHGNRSWPLGSNLSSSSHAGSGILNKSVQNFGWFRNVSLWSDTLNSKRAYFNPPSIHLCARGVDITSPVPQLSTPPPAPDSVKPVTAASCPASSTHFKREINLNLTLTLTLTLTRKPYISNRWSSTYYVFPNFSPSMHDYFVPPLCVPRSFFLRFGDGLLQSSLRFSAIPFNLVFEFFVWLYSYLYRRLSLLC